MSDEWKMEESQKIFCKEKLIAGKLNLGRHQLRYQDVCKLDMELIIDLNKREELVIDRSLNNLLR